MRLRKAVLMSCLLGCKGEGAKGDWEGICVLDPPEPMGDLYVELDLDDEVGELSGDGKLATELELYFGEIEGLRKGKEIELRMTTDLNGQEVDLVVLGDLNGDDLAGSCRFGGLTGLIEVSR